MEEVADTAARSCRGDQIVVSWHSKMATISRSNAIRTGGTIAPPPSRPGAVEHLPVTEYRTYEDFRGLGYDPSTAIAKQGNRAMSELHRVSIDPALCGGRPCLRGLRIRIRDVLDLLAAGASREEILGDYPMLEAEDITAALEYAARQNDHPVLHVA
jgi:uncharacterized protein (DUF433 family)